MAQITKTSDITFSDVLIVPKYSEVTSRSKVEIDVDMGKFILDVPVISANMRDISGNKMVIEMAKLGCLGIMHRFMSIEDNILNYKEIKAGIEKNVRLISKYNFSDKDIKANWKFGVSVGVKKEERERFLKLYQEGAKIFCIDQAHGHCIMMKEMLQFMREKAGNDIYIIAGNIATSDGAGNLHPDSRENGPDRRDAQGPLGSRRYRPDAWHKAATGHQRRRHPRSGSFHGRGTALPLHDLEHRRLGRAGFPARGHRSGVH